MKGGEGMVGPKGQDGALHPSDRLLRSQHDHRIGSRRMPGRKVAGQLAYPEECHRDQGKHHRIEGPNSIQEACQNPCAGESKNQPEDDPQKGGF